MLKTCINISFDTNYSLAKSKLKNVYNYIANEIPGITEDDLFDLRVIYDELIKNAIIHGNKLDKNKKVALDIEMKDHLIISAVEDEGDGFNHTYSLKRATIFDDVYSEHGRGLGLVLSLADYVEWNDTGNRVLFHKKY